MMYLRCMGNSAQYLHIQRYADMTHTRTVVAAVVINSLEQINLIRNIEYLTL